MRRHAAATPTRTAAISRSAGRPTTLPPKSSNWVGAEPNHTSSPTLNAPRISAPAPTRAVPLRVSRARPRSGPGESSSAAAVVQESRTVNATAGSAYPAKAGTAPAAICPIAVARAPSPASRRSRRNTSRVTPGAPAAIGRSARPRVAVSSQCG